jgi:hypothetical protein
MSEIYIAHQYSRFFCCEFFNDKDHQNIKLKAKLERIVSTFLSFMFTINSF